MGKLKRFSKNGDFFFFNVVPMVGKESETVHIFKHAGFELFA